MAIKCRGLGAMLNCAPETYDCLQPHLDCITTVQSSPSSPLLPYPPRGLAYHHAIARCNHVPCTVLEIVRTSLTVRKYRYIASVFSCDHNTMRCLQEKVLEVLKAEGSSVPMPYSQLQTVKQTRKVR